MSDHHPISPEKPLLVDFQQQGASAQLFPNPPLLTSHHSGWSGIHLEDHRQPSYDNPEHRLTMHIVGMNLCSNSSERWFDGNFQREYKTQGATAIIPAGTLHRSLCHKEDNFIFVAVDPTLLVRLGQQVAAPDDIELIPHFATLQDPLIQGIIFSLKDELESRGMGGSLYVEQLTTTLAIHLLRKYGVRKPQISTYSDGLPKYKLKQVLEYINANLDCDIKLVDLAELVGMSQYYFCHLFKQSMGIAPYQYVIQQRVERAKQLLKCRDVTISDVALVCGFANQSHFSKHFRKITGMTPKAYRDR